MNVGGVVTRYTYDALGRRISKASEQNSTISTTTFYWNGDVLLGEVNSGIGQEPNRPNRTYLFEPFSFKPLALVQNNEVFHYHTDHIGTPREITNAKMDVVWSSSFKTYGALAVAHVNEVDNPLRFQGQYYDSETGLHYNRHRYYDPNCGQFTTQDPIGLLGGMNAYQYAPNPMTWVDPWGLSCKELKVQVTTDVETPYGPAVQSDAPKALAARADVENGSTFYRTGTLGKSQAAEAQFWALENPNSAGYASRYGIPQENIENANFIETAVLKPGTPFITRPAPGIGENIGGGIEVVVPENGVSMKYFGTK